MQSLIVIRHSSIHDLRARHHIDDIRDRIDDRRGRDTDLRRNIGASADIVVVERLCGRLFLITDNDNATGAKAQRYEQLRAKLEDRYCCLACKEVENLLTPKIIKAVVNQYEGGSATFNDFTQKDYAGQPLGTFIETKALSSPRARKASYAMDNTVRDKPDFCLRATEEMQTLEDISPDWVEDPVWMDRITDVAALAESTRAPLAGGETLGGLGQLRELIELGRIDTPHARLPALFSAATLDAGIARCLANPPGETHPPAP